jgi:BAR domain
VPQSDVEDQTSASFKGKMTVGRRRFGEKIGQKMGKETTDDAEFEERFKAVMELQAKVLKVKDAMKSLLDSTRAMSQRAVDLSNACGEADARDQDFITTQLQLDQSMRSMLDESVGKALESLDRKLAPFKDLEERVKTRNNLKLDYDHYVRKVSCSSREHCIATHVFRAYN